MTPATRERYQKALIDLVGVIPTTPPTKLNVVEFCLAHDLKSSFFDALRDLECLVLDFTRTDDGSYFTRTDKLMRITPEEVLNQMKASGRPKPVVNRPAQTFGEEMAEMEADGSLQALTGNTRLATIQPVEVVAEEAQGKGKNPVMEKLNQLMQELDEMVPPLRDVSVMPTGLMNAQCKETRPVNAPNEDDRAIKSRGNPLTFGVVDEDGDMIMSDAFTQADVSTLPDEPIPVSPKRINTGVFLGVEKPSPIPDQIDAFVERFGEKPTDRESPLVLTASPITDQQFEQMQKVLSQPARDYCETAQCGRCTTDCGQHGEVPTPATIPVLTSNAEAAAYCVDVILAHCPDEPNDQTGLLASVVDLLRVRQINQAHQLREEVAPILSRASAFEAAATTTF